MSEYQIKRNNLENNRDHWEEIEAWEDGETNKMFCNVPGMFSNTNMPVFQLCFDPNNTKFNFTTILEETEEYIVIVPAGYMSEETPTYKMANPPVCRIDKDRALMSLVHVLVIPKKRIYSALTLKKSDIPLIETMQNVADKWVRYLTMADSTVPFSKQWVLEGGMSANPDNIEKFKITPKDMSLVNNSRATYDCPVLHADHIPVATTFHLNHSVGWLHMHGFANNLLTSGYDVHFEKNVPVDTILNELNNIPDDLYVYYENYGFKEFVKDLFGDVISSISSIIYYPFSLLGEK